MEKSIEDFVKFPFVQKIYIRPDWRQVQSRPGRLDFPDADGTLTLAPTPGV